MVLAPYFLIFGTYLNDMRHVFGSIYDLAHCKIIIKNIDFVEFLLVL